VPFSTLAVRPYPPFVDGSHPRWFLDFRGRTLALTSLMLAISGVLGAFAVTTRVGALVAAVGCAVWFSLMGSLAGLGYDDWGDEPEVAASLARRARWYCIAMAVLGTSVGYAVR
jgi:hypothetical protein